MTCQDMAAEEGPQGEEEEEDIQVHVTCSSNLEVMPAQAVKLEVRWALCSKSSCCKQLMSVRHHPLFTSLSKHSSQLAAPWSRRRRRQWRWRWRKFCAF